MRAVVILVLGVLVALVLTLVVANPGPTSRHSRINAMVNNLRQLGGAAEQWAIDHHQTGAVLVTEADLTNYLRHSLQPIAGERYVLRRLPQSPEVVLTREVEGRPKGTVICFTTNGEVRFIPPKRIELMRRSAFRLVPHSGVVDALLLMAHPRRWPHI